MNFSMAVFILYGMKKYPRYLIYFLAVMLTIWISLNTVTWREGGAYSTDNGQYGFFLEQKLPLHSIKLQLSFLPTY